MSESHAVVLFHTTSHALRSETVLKRQEIACRLVPVPRQLSSDCGLCLRIIRADRERVLRALREARVETAGVHQI